MSTHTNPLDPDPTIAPIEPITPERVQPATRRRVFRVLFGTMLLVLVANVGALGLLRARPVNRGHWLLQQKWKLLSEQRRPAATLVLGDSSCNQGMRPDVLSAELGGDTLNLCTIGNVLAVNDAWMLGAYLQQAGVPRRVIVVHAYDVWDRGVDRAMEGLLAKVPLELGFWDRMRPRLELGWDGLLRVAVARWFPLYSDEASLARYVRAPRASWRTRFRLDRRGYMRVDRAPPRAAVLSDVRRHRQALRDAVAFRLSEPNERALGELVRLAHERGFALHLVPAPMVENLWREERARSRWTKIDQALASRMDGREPRVHRFSGPPPTFPASAMENVDHLLHGPAADYSRLVARQVAAAEATAGAPSP